MKLWTYQGAAQSLVSGCVKHSKSKYYNDYECVRKAYAKLATIVGTNQIIWCCVRNGDYAPDDGEVRWTLEVPDSDIFRFVDERIWNRILGFDIGVPRNLLNQWKLERPANGPDMGEYLRRRKEEYLRANPPGDLWTHLFIERADVVVSDESDEQLCNALLEHPIQESWIVGKSL